MKHIFFVEDDLSLINGLSFALKKQGYELTVARTGREAEQFFLRAMAASEGSEQRRYAKIYTELKMGMEVCTDEEDT